MTDEKKLPEPWVGWMVMASPGYVVHPLREPVEGKSNVTVLVTSIDQDLPYPGDGHDWRHTGHPSATAFAAKSAPDSDGYVMMQLLSTSPWSASRIAVHVDELYFREPEPSHRPWCRKVVESYAPYLSCTCERRSGEDRREDVGRRDYDPEAPQSNYDETIQRAGRRSGADRRKL